MSVTPEFWLQTAVYLIGGASAVIAVAFRIGRMEAKLATKDELERAKAEGDEKRARIYQRFDEYKSHFESNFVRRDMCGQMHLTSKDELKRIDEEYKAFRHEMRNQVQQIFDKIDQLKELLNDRRGNT